MDKKYTQEAIGQRIRDRLSKGKQPANQFSRLRQEIQRRFGTRQIRRF